MPDEGRDVMLWVLVDRASQSRNGGGRPAATHTKSAVCAPASRRADPETRDFWVFVSSRLRVLEF